MSQPSLVALRERRPSWYIRADLMIALVIASTIFGWLAGVLPHALGRMP